MNTATSMDVISGLSPLSSRGLQLASRLSLPSRVRWLGARPRSVQSLRTDATDLAILRRARILCAVDCSLAHVLVGSVASRTRAKSSLHVWWSD